MSDYFGMPALLGDWKTIAEDHGNGHIYMLTGDHYSSSSSSACGQLLSLQVSTIVW